MRWLLMILFFAIIKVKEDSAFPLLSGKRIKKLLDTVLGVEKWALTLSSGDDVEETANIAEKMQKIIIQSNNLPDSSDMDNSTILMDFKKGMMAALFLDTDMGHMCFFTEDDSSFVESASEIIGRQNATTPIQQGNPITFYALNSHRIRTGPALLKMGGTAVFKMCGHCIENGKVYHVIKDSTERMKPITLTASGFVSAIQPGKSVPIIFKMEEDSMGDNVIREDMSVHVPNRRNDKDVKNQHGMDSDMSMKTDDTKISNTDSSTDDKTKIIKKTKTDDVKSVTFDKEADNILNQQTGKVVKAQSDIKMSNTDSSTDDKTKITKNTKTDNVKSVTFDKEADNILNQQTGKIVTDQSKVISPNPPNDTTTGAVALTTTPSITTESIRIIGPEISLTTKDMSSSPAVTVSPSTIASNAASSMKVDDTAVSMDTKDSLGIAMTVPMKDDVTDKPNS